MKKKILLVDDEKIFLKTLGRSIKEKGYAVTTAESKDTALLYLRQRSYDIVITDLVMDGMTGIHVLKEAKKIDPDILVIIFTAHGDMVSAIDALRAHADDYLLKPCDTEDLLFHVSRCLEKQNVKKEVKKYYAKLEKTNKELKAETHERKRVEEELAKHRQYLEEMVQMRTLELSKINGQLIQQVSERKQIEDNLQLFRNLIDQSNDAIFVIDPKTNRFMDVNDKACTSLGYSRKELLSMGAIDIVAYKPDRFFLEKQIVEIREKRKMVFEGIYIHKSGREFPTEVSVKYVSQEKYDYIVAVVRDITERKRTEETLRNALVEVEELKNRLEAENIYLQDEVGTDQNFEEIISNGREFKKVLRKVEQVAPTTTTVLILGETGTGKELIARAIHHLSNCNERPLIKVNCAALAANLIESELFGHEKGAFTGAHARKIGRFELADGGTIFLDEIGDLPLNLQAKLLRVIQEGEIERLGGQDTIKIDVRIIAATNRQLEESVKSGFFRKDLYYRLNVFPITCMPLREREDDLLPLVNFFVKKYSAKTGKNIKSIPAKTINLLKTYKWPGNIRELENIVERAIVLSSGTKLELAEELFKLHPHRFNQGEDSSTLKGHEQSYILRILEECNWVISGKNGAAARLDVPTSTLRDKMKKYGIKRQ